MSKIELLAKTELLNKYEAMIEEMKNEADTIRNSIKAEMKVREGGYFLCIAKAFWNHRHCRWFSLYNKKDDQMSIKEYVDPFTGQPVQEGR